MLIGGPRTRMARRRGVVVGAVVARQVGKNKAEAQHARDQAEADRRVAAAEEKARADAQKEYEEKLARETASSSNSSANSATTTTTAPQPYYNCPQQMNYVAVPAAASYSAPAPAGAQYAAPSANVGGPPPGPPPPLQQAPQLIQAIVLAPYQARSATELSISAGEHVTILEDAPSGWTKALNAAGVSGWVPATYLKR